ncbi:MAG: hypothetical protein MJ192_09625 [Clostridia bacterium]|nr:hypothetical protein [Clostridia bacterium]
MKPETMLDLLSGIDLSLVEDAADAYESGNAGSLKKRGPFPKRWMNIAACLLLAAGVIFAARCLVLRFGGLPGQTVTDTTAKEKTIRLPGTSYEPSEPPLPWDGCYTFKAYTSRGCFAPGKPVVIHVELSVGGDWLTDGELLLMVIGASDDFTLSCPALPVDGDTIRIGRPGLRYTEKDPMTFDIILIPEWDDWVSGVLSVSLRYVPDDPQQFIERAEASNGMEYREGWQEALFKDDTLRLTYQDLYYAADRVETRVRAESSAMGLLNDMLIAHYRSMAISGKEFSRIFYEEAYRDHVCAAVHSTMPEQKAVRYTYQSRNIRYESKQYIASEEMYALSREINQYHAGETSPGKGEYPAMCRRLADLCLADMRERGVITEAEYEAELAYLNTGVDVDVFEPGFPMGLDGLDHSVVQKHRDTHGEP